MAFPDGHVKRIRAYAMTQPARQQPMIDDAGVQVERQRALLRQAVSDFGRVVYANSLGAEAMVLTDLICDARARRSTSSRIDTGRLPEETLALLERLERRYHRRIRAVLSRRAGGRALRARARHQWLLQQPRRAPELLPDPQGRAVQARDRRLWRWVTACATSSPSSAPRRRPIDAATSSTAWRRSARCWTGPRPRSGATSARKQLHYNPLHDRGYPSIGCAPCTRPIEPGQDHRAGRWWWEQPESRECGLHPRQRSLAVS